MKINKLVIKILILVFYFNCCKIYYNFCQSTSQQLNFKGSISCNSDLKKMPEFRIFFNGRYVNNDEDGFYSFPLEENIDKFYFLICKNVKQCFEKINTIESLKLDCGQSYKFYSFTKTGTSNAWTQKDEEINEEFVLPNKCVVALVNPKYVEKVKSWPVNLKGNFVKLPQVILNSKLYENKLKREASKSLLRSLDLLPFHQRILTQNKNSSEKVKISISQ